MEVYCFIVVYFLAFETSFSVVKNLDGFAGILQQKFTFVQYAYPNPILKRGAISVNEGLLHH